MASILTKGELFPVTLSNEVFNLVRGKSALARLSEAEPISFTGNEYFTFTLDSEVDVVAENGAKSNGGGAIAPVTVVPVKIEYGMRVSDEFKYASEERRIDYIRQFADGFARKAARGLDIMAFHGLNPRTGTASAVIGTNHFDSVVTQTAQGTAGTALIEAGINAVMANEHEVTGLAMSNALRLALAQEKKGTASNEALYPELAWGSAPSAINGLPVDVNPTVGFQTATALGYVGNFRDYFKWGFAKDIAMEVIEYGNPDNNATLGDLKGHNQIYLRGEAYVGWAILDPTAFARMITQ